MNAMAHCIEGLYAVDRNPIVSRFATEGIGALARSLARIAAAPDDVEARADALYGAWLAGIVLGSVSSGIHHKLCHTLGGTFNLPHAAAYRDPAACGRIQQQSRARGDAHHRGSAGRRRRCPGSVRSRCPHRRAGGAEEHRHALRWTRTRRGMATRNPYANPRPVEYAGVLALLRNAYIGARPGAN